MGKLAPTFWVGIVVIAAFFAFVYMFGSVEKSTVTADESYVVWGTFEDVTGLVERSRVTISGIPVGEIEKISLDTESGRKARVAIRLENRIRLYSGVEGPDGVVRNGAIVTRKQASLLGDYYLEITPGIAGDLLADGGEIPIVVSHSGLTAIMNQMESSSDMFARMDRIAANIEKVTASLAEVLGEEEGVERLAGFTDDLRASAANVRGITGDMREFLKGTVFEKQESFEQIVGNLVTFTEQATSISRKVDASIERSLRNIEELTGEVRGLVDRNAGKVDKSLDAIQTSLAQVQGSLRTLDGLLVNLRETSRKVNEGEGTIGRLVNDDHLVDSLEEVVDDTGELVRSISRLQTRVELRVEHAPMTDSTKTYFALRLQPKADKYYQFEIIDDPHGRTRHMQRVTETNDPRLPPLLREDVTETSDDLKFSLYFAKRWRFLVGRFGIIESSGGLGMDFVFLGETLKFAFDAFDFGADRAPRLKALASVRLFDHFLVMGGVDDIFNDGRRDYFFGLGFSFTDDDLKALLTVAPTPSL